jgi:hypothetical protein
MKGLTWDLKQKVKNGFVKLSELRPHSRDIAKRLIADGVFYVDGRGFLRSNEL